MIYLDNGATTLHKPACVYRAVGEALRTCANPGRGGYSAAMEAARRVYACREAAGILFGCAPEQVVFTQNCTQGLNMAIRTLVKPGGRVVISGFEHNAVTRPLHLLGAQVTVAGRRLFSPENTLEEFEKALKNGVEAAVFTHVSNVFGYILPVKELAALCRERGVPFAVDCAQSAGTLPVTPEAWGADFVAMPGHKGLLGPQGTGLLLCRRLPDPLLAGGTGSESEAQDMPGFLPDRGEAGTLNVPGIAGLEAGIRWILRQGPKRLYLQEHGALEACVEALRTLPLKVFSGDGQLGTVSFVPQRDCEEVAAELGRQGIAVRAGLHCAPLAHESAGTLQTGTVRVSFGPDASINQVRRLYAALKGLG